MRKFAVDLLKEMVQLYSPTGHESEISHFLFNQLENQGFTTHIDDAGNVIGEYGAGSPKILLCGHMDTVPGVLPVKIKGGRLFGRGTVDAKSSLATMITVASMLLKDKFSGKIIVAGVVEEEGSGRGVQQLLKDNLEVDYALFGEPSGVDQITIAYKGSLHVKILVRTRTGHSSAPWFFDNAIEKAFEIYRLLQDLKATSVTKESKFYSISSCLIKIRGGSLSSNIPSKCEFHIDFRFPPQITSMKLFENVESILVEYGKNHPTVSVKAQILDSCESYEANTRSVLVRSLSWAIRLVKGKPATWLRKTGTGDMNIYGASTMIPTATYGVGDSRLDHTSNESVDLKEYEESILILFNGLKKLVELHQTNEI